MLVLRLRPTRPPVPPPAGASEFGVASSRPFLQTARQPRTRLRRDASTVGALSGTARATEPYTYALRPCPGFVPADSHRGHRPDIAAARFAVDHWISSG